VVALGEVVLHGAPWAYTKDYRPWYYEHSHPYMILPQKGEPTHSPIRISPQPQHQPHPGGQIPYYILGDVYSC